MVEATQAYHPQVIQATRAIAMYEASARPRRRRLDRRASQARRNRGLALTTTKPGGASLWLHHLIKNE